MNKKDLRKMIREEIHSLMKEEKTIGRNQLKSIMRKKKDVLVFVKNKELHVTDISDPKYGLGIDKSGNEEEFKYSDIEFATVGGQRV